MFIVNSKVFSQFLSNKSSRILSLLLVSMAECHPLSNHSSTYFEGWKSLRGGPTILMNKSAEIVLVFNEALVGVAIRFICENPHSHSLEEMGLVFRVCIKSSSFSGYVFSRMYSRIQNCSTQPRLYAN